MLKNVLISFNAKLIFFLTILAGLIIAYSMIFDVRWIGLVGPLYFLIGILVNFISNKKYTIQFLGFFSKKLYPVELISFDDTRHFTLAKYNSTNQMVAPVYFSNNIGQVILLEDGSVDKASESSYIKFWIPLNKIDRVQHILTNNIPI